ncbi:MAG: EamA family transporter [Candidatus Riflebacteria bacterium]|nr:EamA family transporter [Candidatus Riflebacteria bacterium]
MGELLLVICGMVRSTDLFFRISVMKEVPVLAIITWEHFINAMIVIPIIFKHRKDYAKMTLRDVFLMLLIGCGSSVCGLLFFSKAYSYMNPALVILLQKLQPIITITFGILLLGEKPGKGFYFWALTAIIASYFVSFSMANPFSGEWYKSAAGVFFAVLAAFFWGGGTAWGKLLLNKYDPLFVFGNRLFIGAIFAGALSSLFGSGMHVEKVFASSNPLIFKFLYMALVPGFLATFLFYKGLNQIRASVSAVLELVFPLSSILIMWFFFNKPLDNVQIAAGAILCTSIIIITTRFSARKQ